MNKRFIQNTFFSLSIVLVLLGTGCGSEASKPKAAYFEPTQESATPWVYWYWMHGAYSKEGITADLEAMKEAGIAGAYLMSIKGPTDPPMIDPPIIQTTPEWWDMVKHAMEEADRLGLKLAMHSCDGFAVAGGPWITPEKSMQKVVWSDTVVTGGKTLEMNLTQPETVEGYYKDIAVFAYPVKEGYYRTSAALRPKVRSSAEEGDLSYLLDNRTEKRLGTNDEAWIEYAFEEPFTCRSIRIKTSGNSYQAHRLKIAVSDDGENFTEVTRLTPPRHGWQDWDYDYTHSIEPLTSKYFRFIYDKEGTEPGAEDLDAAKWKPSLKVRTIELSESPKINQFEGKSGGVWRISQHSNEAQIPQEACVSPEELVNISEKITAEGRLNWQAPEGKWRIMRFGHTSTGHTNATGGGGKGLEVDKFDAEAVQFQFDHWFGKAIETAGPKLTERVLKILHIDSWEAGSQNWSHVFAEEFRQRRGYDLLEFLPVMAGVPIESAESSERVLFDIRKTIAELTVDKFFVTMKEEAHKNGVEFSAENVAPTMVSDGLLHYKHVDLPGGEFWLNSPTHDKPNDIREAISGAHIYGKPIVQAEAFTQLRMDWDEHPGSIKVVGDRNYALGINRFFYHVFVHNPWLDRKPGMTLDAIGLFFQRDQTWWKPGKAWVDYARNVQYQLQKGVPVVDLAVFTGEEIPSRSVLPDRLVPFLPGIFGIERVESEKQRWANQGQPTRQIPAGVTHGANMADPEDWTDPLRGYHYDSFNPDALLNLAEVKNGKVVLPSGAEYAFLVFPGSRKISPHADRMSTEVAQKILELVKAGATVLVDEKPMATLGYKDRGEAAFQNAVEELWAGMEGTDFSRGQPLTWQVGKGKVVKMPYKQETFTALGLAPDVIASEGGKLRNQGFAFAHRKTAEEDIYFISNQKPTERTLELSFRISGKRPQFYDPVWDRIREVEEWKVVDGRTVIPVKLAENASLFVIFGEETTETEVKEGENWPEFEVVKELVGDWSVSFDTSFWGPEKAVMMASLQDWSQHEDDRIKYYSGTAVYSKTFDWDGEANGPIALSLGKVGQLAQVYVNGKDCGVAWTYPFRVDISEALKEGENQLEIAVTNTWANRIIGDQKLPEEERKTWSLAPLDRIKNNPLMESGLLGPVRILEESKEKRK